MGTHIFSFWVKRGQCINRLLIRSTIEVIWTIRDDFLPMKKLASACLRPGIGMCGQGAASFFIGGAPRPKSGKSMNETRFEKVGRISRTLMISHFTFHILLSASVYDVGAVSFHRIEASASQSLHS